VLSEKYEDRIMNITPFKPANTLAFKRNLSDIDVKRLSRTKSDNEIMQVETREFGLNEYDSTIEFKPEKGATISSEATVCLVKGPIEKPTEPPAICTFLGAYKERRLSDARVGIVCQKLNGNFIHIKPEDSSEYQIFDWEELDTAERKSLNRALICHELRNQIEAY